MCCALPALCTEQEAVEEGSKGIPKAGGISDTHQFGLLHKVRYGRSSLVGKRLAGWKIA